MNWKPYLDALAVVALLFVGLSLLIFTLDMVVDKFRGRRK